MATMATTDGGDLTEFLGSAGREERPASENVARALGAVRRHLGMRVAFVAEFVDGRRVYRHVDTDRDDAPIRAGESDPLEETLCLRVTDGRLPGLLVDARTAPGARDLPVVQRLPIGAHLSVPIRLSDGQLYGTFCCFTDRGDPSLNARDLQTLRAVAEMTAFQIDRDLSARRAHGTVRSRIESVLASDALSMAFQPIVDLATCRVLGVECLARFAVAPVRSPDQWFAEAGQVGLGLALELAALRRAFASLPEIPAGLEVSVNVSPQTLCSPELVALLEETDASRVTLEMTEHADVPDYASLARAVEPLRRRGARLAIDDVGAGFASLRHILELRPDSVKLDVSLTRGIDADEARRALAGALIAFSRRIGAPITAEGVETAAELDALRELGVQRAQGYHLGRPATLGALLLRLADAGASRIATG